MRQPNRTQDLQLEQLPEVGSILPDKRMRLLTKLEMANLLIKVSHSAQMGLPQLGPVIGTTLSTKLPSSRFWEVSLD
jgi:hypothetical protein